MPESSSATRIRQVLEALPPETQAPVSRITPWAGLAIHVVRPIIDALLENGRLQHVRVVNPRGTARMYYARAEVTVHHHDHDTGTRPETLLSAMSATKLYELNQIVRVAGISIAAARPLVTALVESGHIAIAKKSSGNRVRNFYRLTGTVSSDMPGTATDRDTAPPSLTNFVPKFSSHDVLKATMQPGTCYRASTLAGHLGLSTRRVTELLAALQRDGHVIRMTLPIERPRIRSIS